MVKEEYAHKIDEYHKRFKEDDELIIEALDWLRDYYHGGSSFSSTLVYLIQKADGLNRLRIGKGFPMVVGLFELGDKGGGEGWNSSYCDFRKQIEEGF